MGTRMPFAVPETRPSTDDFNSTCPFCAIVSTYPPVSPLEAPGNPALDPNLLDPEAYVAMSTEHAVAFLDIGPLTRGHTLVCPRKHREKIGDLTPDENAQIGRLLPLLGRAVTKAVMPDIPHEEADYNIVQNNGPGAAQVVPHVHYHIVPRPPIGYKLPPPTRQYAPNSVPEGMKATAILFGRGMRHYRDDEDAEELIEEMRRCIKEEWARTMIDRKEAVGARGKGRGGNVVTEPVETADADVDEAKAGRRSGRSGTRQAKSVEREAQMECSKTSAGRSTGKL